MPDVANMSEGVMTNDIHIKIINAALPHGDLSRRIKAFRSRK